MPRSSLLRSADEADEATAGLQIFLDNLPQADTDIKGCILELIALSTAFQELDYEFPDYARASTRMASDVDLTTRSLHYTLEHVCDMFGETRHMKYSGERPYRRAWDELEWKLNGDERDFGLFARLETYSVFMHNILSSLRGERVEPGEIIRDRDRINRLLKKQEPVQETFVRFSFNEPPNWPRHPMNHFPSFPFPQHHPMPQPPPSVSTWSDDSGPFAFPPAPEPPRTWGSPISPTLSSTSQQTWESNSTGAMPQPNITHWAVRVFNGQHPSTRFRQRGDPTNCYGRPESASCTDRLKADKFIEVLRLPLDATRVYVRLFWRPEDHRSRILLSVKDSSQSSAKKYCIPLTALKLIRSGPNIKLCRYSNEDGDFNLWASLNFTYYEQLILFYCAFAAMKSQDWKEYPEILTDRFHKRDRSEEKEEFSGEIKDDRYLHALRIYKDIDSGGIRLEARARRGKFTATPIWTAFITELVDDEIWIRRIGTKVLQLGGLKPYVFVHEYTPPKGKTGKFRLQFTSQKDANAFVEMVNELRLE